MNGGTVLPPDGWYEGRTEGRTDGRIYVWMKVGSSTYPNAKPFQVGMVRNLDGLSLKSLMMVAVTASAGRSMFHDCETWLEKMYFAELVSILYADD